MTFLWVIIIKIPEFTILYHKTLTKSKKPNSDKKSQIRINNLLQRNGQKRPYHDPKLQENPPKHTGILLILGGRLLKRQYKRPI